MELRRLPHVPLPGPRPIPLLGPMGTMLRFFSNPVRCLRGIHRRYGNLAAVSAGDASLVCAFGPEYNRQVLSAPDLFRNSVELPMPVPPGSSLERLTRFLVAVNGKEHDWLRRMMMPLFQKSYLDNYRADILAVAEEELGRWRVGETIDVSQAMADLTLRIAFRCFFGLDLSGQTRTLADMSLRFAEDATSIGTGLLPVDLPVTPYGKFLRFCDELEGRLKEIIRERQRKTDAPRDALSILIAARDENGAGLSETQLVGSANELFIAGHKTTAGSLTWTLFMLERHPRVLSDVLDELAGTLRGDAPTVEQIGKLSLLDAVVKESQRLMSPPFLFFRRPSRSTRVGTVDLPPGAGVIISPLITHHMAELYPDPDRFKPERWSKIQPSPFEYMPFGAGPRTCLGASFAALSLRLLLAMILQRYSVSVQPNAEVSYRSRGPIMGTQRGLPMRIGPRDRRVATPPPIRGNIRELVELN